MDSFAEIQVSELGIEARSKKEVFFEMNEMFTCLPSRMLTTDSFLKHLLAISDTSSVLRSKYAVFLSGKDSG